MAASQRMKQSAYSVTRGPSVYTTVTRVSQPNIAKLHKTAKAGGTSRLSHAYPLPGESLCRIAKWKWSRSAGHLQMVHLLAKQENQGPLGSWIAVGIELCLEKINLFKMISLLAWTVARSIEGTINQLKTQGNDFEWFSLALDEMADVSNIAPLFIWEVNAELEVIKKWVCTNIVCWGASRTHTEFSRHQNISIQPGSSKIHHQKGDCEQLCRMEMNSGGHGYEAGKWELD